MIKSSISSCLLLSLLSVIISSFNNSNAFQKERYKSIIWQSGSSISQLKDVRCLAADLEIDYIQTFRFDRIMHEIDAISNASDKRFENKCRANIPLILFIGPTRQQLRQSDDSLYWLRANLKAFDENYPKLIDVFGDKFYLQVADEPKQSDIGYITSACHQLKGRNLFLSLNKQSLQLIKHIPIDCFDLLEFHDYRSAIQRPNIFVSLLSMFNAQASGLFSNKSIQLSTTVPIFIKTHTKSDFSRRIVNQKTLDRLASVGIKPGYYGAFLSPNIGFLQEASLKKHFLASRDK